MSAPFWVRMPSAMTHLVRVRVRVRVGVKVRVSEDPPALLGR